MFAEEKSEEVEAYRQWAGWLNTLRPACLPLFLLYWLQSFTRRCSIEFQSWVQRIDKGFVHSLHQVIITSLLEDKQTFKHGRRWSKCIVLPTVLRSKKKKKWMMMKSSSVPLASLNSRYFEDYSILNYSNHVQSDNKDFSCALGSIIAICTCPPSKVCVPFSPSP